MTTLSLRCFSRALRTVSALKVLAIVAFGCRAVVPLGYMPAPFSEGGPFIPCHGVLAGGAFQMLASMPETSGATAGHEHAGAHHDGAPDDGSGVHDAWQHCPLGVAASSAAFAVEYTLELPELDHVFEHRDDSVPAIVRFPSFYLARAPPA